LSFNTAARREIRRNTAAGREMRRVEEDGRRSRGRPRPETKPQKRLGAGELILPDVALHRGPCLALAGFEQGEGEASGGAGRSRRAALASVPPPPGKSERIRDKTRARGPG
jgi:hypothetical protein